MKPGSCHPALRRYFETELAFLGPEAIARAQAGIALWREGDLMTDTELLDWLDKQHERSGFAWCALRASTTRRGWRLHSIPYHEAKALGVEVYPTPREALKAVAGSEQSLKA